ncbi:formimidoylglutamate deiminase [Lacibacterium aquatile]|uniref:Formimidoylglutamate deiminase n=1 Tax=Lacibacterium aquatile TaxID=1168082 RepID=A0ABW5DSC4_9PROT
MTQRSYFLDHALLPGGWRRDVRLTTDAGRIASLQADASAEGATRLSGFALPGMPNLHSHAFQRGMAGLAERRGPANDSFWTWREVMYRFNGNLTPDDLEAIAAYAYLEMLEGGFTSVAEFHYLHHAIDGTPFADLGEMSGRILAAAKTVGIGVTLLPVFYNYSGFGGLAPVDGQRRFINAPDRYLQLVARAGELAKGQEGAIVGMAPHSLRAVTPETLTEIVRGGPGGPVHIHIAEQMKEVNDCIAWSGKRPVRWLLDNQRVDQRWCLVHATHLTDDEVADMAASGAVAGLCPLTEANLGDGIFRGTDYIAAHGIYGIGSDSNVEIDAAGELKMLEYSQRLGLRGRNLMTSKEGESTGRRLVDDALEGGAQAMGQNLGVLDVGARADFIVLDGDHPDVVAADGDRALDAWIFCGGRAMVKHVVAGGEAVVAEGRHAKRDAILDRYRKTLARVLSA